MTKSEEIIQSRIDISGVQGAATQIDAELHKFIVGQQELIEFLTISFLADGHVLLEGVPGIAKTLTAKLMARTTDMGFSRIQFTPDLMPSDVIGTSVFNPKKGTFEFNHGPVFSNLILIDEINRAPAKTQAALFEVMEERQITVDGTTYKMERPFIVIATQNPIEQEGTYRLPEAQIDRFLFKIDVGYPSPEEEATLLTQFHERRNPANLSDVRSVLSAAELIEHQERTKSVILDAKIIQYIVSVVQSTRNSPSVFLGASPRASLAIMASSKALAATKGRDFVIPEDVQHVIYPALRHRLLLTPEMEMEGTQPDDIIKQILERIEVPR